MRIIFSVSASGSFNPFLKTLTDAIRNVNDGIEMAFSPDLIWTDDVFDYDILHIMWPEFLVNEQHTSVDLRSRLIEIKKRGVHIVSTCHNIEPHYSTDLEKVYAIIYSYELSDVIHHMGSYSLNYLKNKFPNVKHELIQHHIYDNLYKKFPTKEEACKHLNLSTKVNYILCLGAFRSPEENELIKYTIRHLKENFCIIAPAFVFAPTKRWDLRYYWHKFITYANKLIPNIYYISDEDLPYYLSVSDISLIHRPKILNSGNLPLGMYAGNVVIGPNVGNVGEILLETNNFVFNKQEDIPRLIDKALIAAKDGLGVSNKKFATEHWSSKEIANTVLNSYNNLLQSSQC